MEHVDERLFQNTFKEMKCVLNNTYNIGQLSYAIFENYGVKETIYNLKQ